MVKLFFACIDMNMADHTFQRLLEHLPEKEKQKIVKFLRREDRLRSLFGKLLLWWALKAGDYPLNNFPELFYDCHQRPYQKHIANLDFNLSHSGEWVICGITNQGKIGVDVEYFRPKIGLEIAERYFAEEEKRFLKTLHGQDQLAAFYHLWTLKEAYIKFEGSTFAIPLNSFWFDTSTREFPRLYFNSGPPPGRERLDFGRPESGLSFRSYWFHKDYVMSVCMECKEGLSETATVDAHELYAGFLGREALSRNE